MNRLVIIALLIATVTAYSCGSLSDLASTKSFTKFNDKQLLFLVVEDSTNAEVFRAPFCPTVDKYGALVINNLWDKIESSETYYLHVEVWAKSKLMYSTSSKTLLSGGKFIPYRVVQVSTVNGGVTDIAWNNNVLCELCSSCLDDACYIGISGKSTSAADMQAKVFVSWIGTDADGYVMTSDTTSISQFNFMDATSLHESMTDLS
ncbi:Prokaryotic membrane lipoprotein lipid attachment site [Carpediemonas membranifera]|uniref:Prokaryotic membrane lipoprotein lipid attachment site n=1 Tax=Carpediemonas membranifera TaxID=201153 RepID=A0A8J6E2C7_9EUKA|nr:Prokaryotic membrane lipoprotein lipid attachment site [Carpediemonas membranifera]|eukprot:KAG9391747.1 Prokaryotic membrane lipoprotein lipid attachment site [Carpediemonas membranifera]